MTSTFHSAPPRFLVCEDGNEYVERFRRFLGDCYEFVPSRSAGELLTQLGDVRPVAAILLDLDFRRTELGLLVDDEGRGLLGRSNEERGGLTANQGIAILSVLRRLGWQLPVVLFADLADTQLSYLTQRFAPLEVVPSHVGLRDLRVRFEELARESD